jgi:protein-disulfide isomerase
VASRKEQKEQARLAREAQEQAAASNLSRGRRLKILGGVVGLAAIAVIVAVLVSSGGLKSSDIKGADAVNARFAGVPQKGPELGDPAAPATLVEFADLKCPFCKEFADGSLPTLVENYVKPGKLKIIFRNVTILDQNTQEPDSTNAAKMAAAVGLQNKLWNFVDLFYINQKDEATTYATDAFLRAIATAIPGLDVNKAMAARNSAAVKAQLALAEEQYTKEGIQGTPSFLVGPSGGKLNQVTLDSLDDPTPITSIVDSLQK